MSLIVVRTTKKKNRETRIEFLCWLVGMARFLVKRLLGKLPASYFSVSCECVSGECTRSHFSLIHLFKGLIKGLIKYFY